MSPTNNSGLGGENISGVLRVSHHIFSRYYTIDSAGASTLSFNATSIQNLVILGLLVLVLGALILPLFGVSIGGLFEEVKIKILQNSKIKIFFQVIGATGDRSDTEYGQAYANFAKRTGMEIMSPVLTALKKGRKKYGKKD